MPAISSHVQFHLAMFPKRVAQVSGLVFLVLAIYITVDVLARKFANASTGATAEIGGYALAVGFAGSLAYGLSQGAHVRIDALLPYYPGYLRRFLNALSLATMAMIAGLISYNVWELALTSLELGATAPTSLQAPIYVPQFIVAVGFTLLAIQAVALLLLQFITVLIRPAERGAGAR